MEFVLRPRVLAAVVMSSALSIGSAGAQTLALPAPGTLDTQVTTPVSPVNPATPGTVKAATPARPIGGDVVGTRGAAAGIDGAFLERERFPFANIAKDLFTDLKNLPSRDNAWIAGVGAGLALAAHPGDNRIARDASRQNSFEEVFDGGAVAGGAIAQIGGAFGTYIVGRVSGNDKLAAVGRDLVRAQVFTTVLTQSIKFAAQRERPDGSDSYSFPSGHASTAFATATVLQRYYGYKVGLPAYALATYVATSRLTENKHYLSDVAFGAAIGVIAGRTSTLHLGGSAFAIAPLVGPNGGAGISLVRLPAGSGSRSH